MLDSKKESLWDKVLPHAEELHRLVSLNVPKGVFDVTPSANIHIVGMLWRALRLYEGVLILLKAQLPEEAMILGRSLFEVSLRLKQLEAEPDNRFALILGWVNESIQQQFGLLQVGKTSGLDTDIDEAIARIEERKKENRRYADEVGVTRYQGFLPEREAANRFGRKEDFWTYEWSHESVHGSDAAWLFARRRPEADRIDLHAKTGDPSVLSSFAHFAAQSMLDSAKAVFTIMGWILPTGLAQTVTNMHALLDAEGPPRPSAQPARASTT